MTHNSHPAADLPAGRHLIEAAVAQLRRSPYPAIRGVTCRLDHGVLTLSGVVPSYHQKQLAQNVLMRRMTDKDVRVENRLEVKSPSAA